MEKKRFNGEGRLFLVGKSTDRALTGFSGSMGASTKRRPRPTGLNAAGGAVLPRASAIAEVRARGSCQPANLICNRRQCNSGSAAPAIESFLQRKWTPEWALAMASDPVLFAATVVPRCCLGGAVWAGRRGCLLRSLTLGVVLAGRLIIAALLVALCSLLAALPPAAGVVFFAGEALALTAVTIVSQCLRWGRRRYDVL